MGCCQVKQSKQQTSSKDDKDDKTMNEVPGKQPRQMNGIGAKSSSAIDQSIEEEGQEQWKHKLWQAIAAFDLNLNKKPILTVIKRFSRENTNDLGDTINIAVGAMIALEFKKFFFLCVVELEKQMRLEQNKELYLTCPFICPPLLERFWDLLILYTRHYEAFCTEIFKGLNPSLEYVFLDKKTYYDNDFQKHINLMHSLESHKQILFPWQSVWPLYESQEELKPHTLSLIWLSQNAQRDARDYFRQEAANMGEQSFIESCKDLIQRYIYRQTGKEFISGQAETMGSYNIPVEQVNCHFNHENRQIGLTDEKVAENLEKVNQIKFSQSFIDTLRFRLLLSYEEARLYLLEYKKFLMMVCCSKEISSPSEQVDHVWHLHQNFDTKQYRADCLHFYGKLLRHSPTFGSCEEQIKFKGIYQKTVEYYLSLFNSERPVAIWEPVDERFQDSLFSCSNVDLQRLAAISLYKSKNQFKSQCNMSEKRKKEYGTLLREKYVIENRQNRRSSKMGCKDCSTYNLEKVCSELNKTAEEIFDPFLIRGGPFFVSRPLSQKTYEGNVISALMNNLYSDFDQYEILQIIKQFSPLGPQESLDSLFDLAIGDLYFNILPSQPHQPKDQAEDKDKTIVAVLSSENIVEEKDDLFNQAVAMLDIKQSEDKSFISSQLVVKNIQESDIIQVRHIELHQGGGSTEQVNSRDKNQGLGIIQHQEQFKISFSGAAEVIRKESEVIESMLTPLSEDSVFQGNPMLQTETIIDRNNQTQEAKQLQSPYREIGAGTPIIVTMTSEENDGNRSFQDKSPGQVLDTPSKDFYMIMRPTTPALPPLPSRKLEIKSGQRKAVKDYGFLPHTFQQKNQIQELYFRKQQQMNLPDYLSPLQIVRQQTSVGTQKVVSASKDFVQDKPIMILDDANEKSQSQILKILYNNNDSKLRVMSRITKNKTPLMTMESDHQNFRQTRHTVGGGFQHQFQQESLMSQTAMEQTGIVDGIAPNLQLEADDIMIQMSSMNHTQSIIMEKAEEQPSLEQMDDLDLITPIIQQEFLNSESFDEEDQNVLNFYDFALGKLSRGQIFEQSLPFSQTKFEVLYAQLLDAPDLQSFTLSDLREALSSVQAWNDEFNKLDGNSLILRILQENPNLCNKRMLVLWGLILSPGKYQSKARVFNNLLYNQSSDMIQFDSKEIETCFFTMIDLSIKLVNHYERYATNDFLNPPEFDEDDLMQIDQAKPRLYKTFLDDIFLSDAILDRNEFVKRVARFGNWIFTSQTLREKIQSAAIENFQEED